MAKEIEIEAKEGGHEGTATGIGNLPDPKLDTATSAENSPCLEVGTAAGATNSPDSDEQTPDSAVQELTHPEGSEPGSAPQESPPEISAAEPVLPDMQARAGIPTGKELTQPEVTEATTAATESTTQATTDANTEVTETPYTTLESQKRVLDSSTNVPVLKPVAEVADLEAAASNVLDFVAERRAAARRVGDSSGRVESQTTLSLEASEKLSTALPSLTSPGSTDKAVASSERLAPIPVDQRRKDARARALSQDGKALALSFGPFAATGLVLCVGLASFGKSDLDFLQLSLLTTAVLVYSTAAIVILEKKFVVTRRIMIVLNAVLVASDILVVTGLVHESKGLDSDLYVLYLLPILLSSFTFGRRGITAASFLVSVSYVLLLLWENASLLPYLMAKHQAAGLAAAYSQQLWRRILARSALLVSVTFIWGRFCEYMSGLERLSTDRLREQLIANNELIGEMKAQAAREMLINSINRALRSTLDLNKIFETAVDELGKALHASCCAIVCPSVYANEPPIVCESIIPSGVDLEKIDENLFFGAKICEFILRHNLDDEETKKTDTSTKATSNEATKIGREGVSDNYEGMMKIFLFHNPAQAPVFEPIREDLARLDFGSLIIKPMIYGDQSKGVLLIADLDHGRIWTDADLQLVNSVAGQVSVAIEHAELVDQLSRKNRDLIQKNLNLDAKNLELRAMQSQLIHQEKMASLGRLVAGIAHELNNPINFVHGNLPYLRNYFDDLIKIVDSLDNLPEEYRAPVNELKKNVKYDFLVTDLDNILADLHDGAERIRHIIRNLKSFSRLDEAELKDASVREGIESSLKILSQYYGRDKIPVKTEFAEIEPILCYPGQLNQVWMNLLSNAAQAVESRSEPRVSVRTEIENGKVLISVSDNGTGIKPEVQSKIFEPFYTTKPVGQGTGLGLSICHSIIERHGGQIWCESALGQGTTFRVRLPIYAHPSELRSAEKIKDGDID